MQTAQALTLPTLQTKTFRPGIVRHYNTSQQQESLRAIQTLTWNLSIMSHDCTQHSTSLMYKVVPGVHVRTYAYAVCAYIAYIWSQYCRKVSVTPEQGESMRNICIYAYAYSISLHNLRCYVKILNIRLRTCLLMWHQDHVAHACPQPYASCSRISYSKETRKLYRLQKTLEALPAYCKNIYPLSVL